MKGFWGAMLMAAGILIAGLSGLCSGILIVSGLMGGEASGPDALSSLMIVLVVGGIPFAIGLGLFFAGRALARSHARDKADASQDFK